MTRSPGSATPVSSGKTCSAGSFVAPASELARAQQQPHLVGELTAVFFRQREAAGEFVFVGGRVARCAQMREQAVAKRHGKVSEAAPLARFEIGLTKQGGLAARDE